MSIESNDLNLILLDHQNFIIVQVQWKGHEHIYHKEVFDYSYELFLLLHLLFMDKIYMHSLSWILFYHVHEVCALLLPFHFIHENLCWLQRHRDSSWSDEHCSILNIFWFLWSTYWGQHVIFIRVLIDSNFIIKLFLVLWKEDNFYYK